MKRYLTLAFVLSGVAFSFSVKAANTIYQETYNQTPAVPNCFGVATGAQGDTAVACDALSTDYIVAESVYQELRIQPTTQDPDIAIKQIDLSVYKSINNGGNPLTITAILINDGASVATSTPLVEDPGNDTDFDWSFVFPSAYHVTNATPVDGVQFQFSGSGATSDSIILRAAPNLYPPNYVNPAIYSGFYCLGAWYPAGCTGQMTNLKDFAVRIWRSNAIFQITYPYNNSTINDYPNVTVTGTCETSAVEVSIYNGITYASSTTAFGSTRTCSSASWFYSFQPEQGFWNITASSTEGFDGIVFYYLAQSQQPNPITPTSTNPYATSTGLFFNLDCSSDTTLSIFCTLANRVGTGRPFSYFPRLVGSVWSAMDNATRTDWIEPVAMTSTTGFVFTIPGIKGDILDGVPASFRERMRPITTIGISIMLLLFIWSLRKKIL